MPPKLISLYLSRAFGALGFQIFSIYATLLAFQISPQFKSLGFLGLSAFLSVVLFSFAAGSICDRSRRKGQYAFILHGVLLVASLIPMPHTLLSLYGLAFFLGSLRVMRTPIYFALAQQFKVTTVSLRFFAVSWQLAAVIGPITGSWLAFRYGLPALREASVGCFALALIFLFPLRTVVGEVMQSKGLGLVESVRFFVANRMVRDTFLIDTIGVLFAGVSAFLPFLLTEAHLSVNYLGLLRALQNVGALVTSLTLARSLLLRQTGKLFVLSVFAFAVLTMAVPFAKALWSLAALFLAIGLLDGVSILIRDLLLFKTVPSTHGGRIYALNSIFISSSDDLGEMESCFTAQLIGIPAAVVVGGAVCALLALALGKNLWTYQLETL